MKKQIKNEFVGALLKASMWVFIMGITGYIFLMPVALIHTIVSR